jgi:hypothetical protein
MRQLHKINVTNIFNSIVEDYSQLDISNIKQTDYPCNKSYCIDDYIYQVELNLLEISDDYVHVSVGISEGGISDYFPFSHSFIVYTDGKVEGKINM